MKSNIAGTSIVPQSTPRKGKSNVTNDNAPTTELPQAPQQLEHDQGEQPYAPGGLPARAPALVIPDSPTLAMGLKRVGGESPVEVVFWRCFRNYDFYVKHEYPEAPRGWEWVITLGRDPIDFDDGFATFEEAELALEASARATVPGFEESTDDSEKMVVAGGRARGLTVSALHWTRERLGQLERWLDR